MEGSARYEDFSVVKSGISRWFVPASATLPGDLCSGDKPHSSADLISLRPIQFSTTRHARYCPYVSALARYHHESLWLKLPIGSYSPSRHVSWPRLHESFSTAPAMKPIRFSSSELFMTMRLMLSHRGTKSANLHQREMPS